MKHAQNGQISAKFAPTNHLHNVSDSELHNEYCRRFTIRANQKLSSSADVAKHVRIFMKDSPDVEVFICIYLSGANRVIDTEILATGTISTASIHIRELIKSILLKQKASSVIFIHNHPSGAEQPSKNDTDLMKKLKSALQQIEVEVLDSLIIPGNGNTGYTSMADLDVI